MKTMQRHSRIAGRAAVALLLAPLGIGGSASAVVQATPVSTHFCAATLVRDYLKPLHKFPPVRHVPNSGRLPFGPKGLLLRVIGNGLRVGPGPIGFVFTDEAVGRSRRLNWTITTELLRLSSPDQPILIETKKRHVSVSTASKINGQRFSVSGSPDFYMVRIEFEDHAGRRLGIYSEYFRVVRPTFIARLGLNRARIEAGQTLFIRIENLGTEAILPASGFGVERYDGERWLDVGRIQNPKLRPRLREVVPAGQVGQCVQYLVPDEPSAARYRITNDIVRANGERRMLRAEFEVEPVPS
jgi:hypothetical protein